MLFVWLPKILHKHCLQFLLGVKMAPRETEDNAYEKFWGDKQRALWHVMVFSGVVNWVGEWYRRFSWRLIFKSDFTPSTLVSMASDNELMSNLLISQMYWLSNVAFHAHFVKNDRAWFQNEPAYCKCIWKVVAHCSLLTQKWWNFQFNPWGRGEGLIRNFCIFASAVQSSELSLPGRT